MPVHWGAVCKFAGRDNLLRRHIILPKMHAENQFFREAHVRLYRHLCAPPPDRLDAPLLTNAFDHLPLGRTAIDAAILRKFEIGNLKSQISNFPRRVRPQPQLPRRGTGIACRNPIVLSGHPQEI